MSRFLRQAHPDCHASLTISTISPSTAVTLQKEEDVGCVTRYTDPISKVDENPLLLLKLLRGDFLTTVGGSVDSLLIGLAHGVCKSISPTKLQ